MTLPVWKDAACTTTLGLSAASTLEAASDADRSTLCDVKRTGRPNNAARALPAVRSHSRRSWLRPGIATSTGSDAGAARSSAMRPAKFPVPKIRMWALVSVMAADVRPLATMVDSAMRTIHSDVAIIGGGLVGTWTAYFLRKRGHTVSVIEKGAVGCQASGVNFGNVRLEGRHPTEFPLALRAIEQWEHIEELIGERCEFTPCGHSYFALDPTELARLERYQREGTAGGLEIELLGANQVRRRLPYVGPDVCGATWSKRDGTANPRLATPAVARAARALGADLYPNTRVVALKHTGDHFRATTDRDLVFEASFVVNASGAWGNEIAEQFGETSPMFEA